MASSSKKMDSASFKRLIKDNNLEDQFLKMAGLSSLDEFSPQNFEDQSTSQAPVTTVPTLSAAIQPAKQQDKSVADAPQRTQPTVASDVLLPFVRNHIIYAPRKRNSAYRPSSLMMDHIVHLINYHLVDNFYFKRSCPDYHPYILRLYFAVLFWIQCLRAGHSVCKIDTLRHQFLQCFLEHHPVESLPIPGPLLPLFKTICSSQPEDPLFGKVYPELPANAGPNRRSEFIRADADAFVLPNVPGIFALLADLNSIINGQQPRYPKKGQHVPVTSDATQPKVFGFHTFPVPNERTDLQKWSLVSSGLQYPCEADARLNEAFAERYNDFDFPLFLAADDTANIDEYLSMEYNSAWFTHVKSVAATASAFFEGSGTLADCPPTGIVANQIVVEYQRPRVAPTAPTCSADKAALFPFSFRLSSSARSLPALAEAMASMAQTNISMFPTHPYANGIGAPTRSGEFWDIRPIDRSSVDDSSYLTLSDTIKKMMKSKI